LAASLKKRSLKALKHQSSTGFNIAAYMSKFAKTSEENLYEIQREIANKLLERSILIKEINDRQSGFGIGFSLRKVWIDEDNDFSGIILIETNPFRSLYWANLKAALKAYEIDNLTEI